MQLQDFNIIPPGQAEPGGDLAEASPLLLRDVQPVAQMDETPEVDWREVVEELALDPVCSGRLRSLGLHRVHPRVRARE